MPFENQESSQAWKIVFVDCIKPKGLYAAMTRFEITQSNDKSKSIRPIFRLNFVDDYFHISGEKGDVAMEEDRIRIRKEKQELFVKWGLIRIEESIDKDTLEDEPEISEQDLEWAAKIERGDLLPSSEQNGINTFIYTPERKIGFD